MLFRSQILDAVVQTATDLGKQLGLLPMSWDEKTGAATTGGSLPTNHVEVTPLTGPDFMPEEALQQFFASFPGYGAEMQFPTVDTTNYNVTPAVGGGEWIDNYGNTDQSYATGDGGGNDASLWDYGGEGSWTDAYGNTGSA